MSVSAHPHRPRQSAAERLAVRLGRLRKWTLYRLEHLAYDVGGLPLAITSLGRPPGASHETEAARYVHELHGYMYWRSGGGPLKALLAAALWTPALATTIYIYTRRNGRAVQARTGKPVSRQIIEQVGLAATRSIAPLWYYMFEFFDDARRQEAGLYLTAQETIGPAYSLLEPEGTVDRMADKVWFADYCRRVGVPAVPVLLHFTAGAAAESGGVTALPESDLFVKPRQGNGGHNAERWDHVGDRFYRNSKGEKLPGPELMTRLVRQSLKEDFVVQPRLPNHPDLVDLANGALSTVRVLTCRNETGGFEATNAAFRMAIGGNNVVDNFHQGGLAANVDLATGKVGEASDMGVRPAVGWRETHPVSGAQFHGRVLPQWREVLDLACRAHRAFPHRTVVGWDVAMLPEGPCIIEGNAKPDLDIHQRVERRPLGDCRIGRLLAFHLATSFLRK